MRQLSVLLILLGIMGFIYGGVIMDTSVSTGYGSVNNLGLMNMRTNIFIASAAFLIAGVVLYGMSAGSHENKSNMQINEAALSPKALKMKHAIDMNNESTVKTLIESGFFLSKSSDEMDFAKYADQIKRSNLSTMIRNR